MSLLSLFRRTPKPPAEVSPASWSARSYLRKTGLVPRRAERERRGVVVEPVAPDPQVVEAITEEYERHQVVLAEVDAKRRADEPFGWLATARYVDEAEMCGRVAELIGSGVSPWDAAVSVFGGAGVALGAVGTGLSATLAASTGAPGVRGCREP